MNFWRWMEIKYADHRDAELKERGDRLLVEMDKRRKKLARRKKRVDEVVGDIQKRRVKA